MGINVRDAGVEAYLPAATPVAGRWGRPVRALDICEMSGHVNGLQR